MGLKRSSNDMVNVACIGVGGAGWFDMHGVARSNKARVVAICDIDESRLERAGEAFPHAARYYDYREMLEKEKSIDAVTVSTPDHTHAPASLMAMKMGKHCFCQKPLGVSIGEAREMAAAAKQSKVATQMGTQGVADSRLRQGIELIRAGVLGTIREVHVWTDRPGTFWPRGIKTNRNHRVPKQLHWENWIGTAPYRPYNPAYHPSGWRGWTDFGTGALGDMGCHNSALAFLALELGLPESVEGKCARTNGEVFPQWSELVFDFPARGNHPALRMFWYDGGRKPPKSLFDGFRIDENGSLLVGENGRYYSAGFANRFSYLLPAERFADYQTSKPELPRPESHYHEWLDGCHGGAVPLCNFIDFAADLTEVMLLGNLAVLLGKRIEWDTSKARAKNCPEADPFIRRGYREGW